MDNNLDNNQGGRRPDKGDPRRDQDPNRNKKNHQSILAFLICLLVTLVCFSLFTNMLQDNSSEITYDKFIDMVNNDEVKSDHRAEEAGESLSGDQLLHQSDRR